MSAVPKWLKPFQGLKRSFALPLRDRRSWQQRSKMAETLSGIETQERARLEAQKARSKMAETLSGIET